MKTYLLITAILLSGTILTGLSQYAQADDDYIEARRLQDAGEILPLQSILKNIKVSFPGKVLEVELEKEKGLIIYEVEILADDGVVREIYINARTGETLSVKEDD